MDPDKNVVVEEEGVVYDIIRTDDRTERGQQKRKDGGHMRNRRKSSQESPLHQQGQI